VAEFKVYGASWCPDCRRASAVGEGAGAAIAIRQYLENKDRN
jgi:thiol-disulfide isomerase/thioredoxin